MRWSALALQIVAAVLFAMTGMVSQPFAQGAPSSVTIGGPFVLTAPDGTTVTEQTYRGKWLLVTFGFTFCPTTCPTTLVEITAAFEKLGASAAEMQAIFITIDPQRDTPKVLAEYTSSFDARIVGLSGDPQQIAAVAQAYGAYYVRHKSGPNAQDYVIDHSTYLYLLDPRGEFVRAFDADTSGERIAAEVRELMTRSHNGKS